jgi:iron complex transport system ATP-binding protein
MITDPLLRLQGVRYRYPGATRDALQGVSLAIAPRQFHAVLGPNGSGKTTLVRIALGGITPLVGRADIDGRSAATWKRQELARVVGVVPQREDNLFPQRVRETVLLGRYPHLSMWGRERQEDHAAVARALAACDVEHLADRWVWTLSGGEYQRVRVARALAQEPRLLVLDEPGTHDLNLAARFADSLLLLEGGRPVASGTPADVLTQETVETVFSWPVVMQTIDGRPQMIPLRQPKESHP